MLPKISVVTPSFNQGRYLEDTILSVLNQGYPNLEYIIVDGGSSDNSVAIIEKYASHLTYWVSEKDKGFAEAINKGFRRSSGEILCWLNSDDVLLPGALHTIARFFMTRPEVDLVFGDRHIIDGQSRLIMKQRYYFYSEWLFRFGKSIPQECSFWRRDIFFQTGCINEAFNYAIDLDLWCRIARKGTIRHIPFFLGSFRRHDEGKSSTIFTKGRQEAVKILTNYYGRYPSENTKRIFNFFLGLSRRLYRLTFLYALKKIFYRKLRL